MTGVDIERAEFIRHNATGTVHVAVPRELVEAWWARKWTERPIYRELYPPGDGPTWLLMRPTPALCGLIAANPGISTVDSWVSHFADADLCWSCRRGWIARGFDVGLLFEHPQDLDDDESEEGT